MLLKVEHETRYVFDPPVRGVIQSHRLTPVTNGSQNVRTWSITTEGATRGAAHRDGAGDQIEIVSLRGQVSEVRVSVIGEVETQDTAGVLRGHRETISPSVYLRQTERTRADVAIQTLANDAVTGIPEEAVLDRAHALSAAITAAMPYRPGETAAQTTAAQALAAGVGVCQDHTQVLSAAARAVGLPARYVTGYLHAQSEGQEASHAWAEIFVPGLGWVGFDASNGCCPDDNYVRVGSGLDALDAAPIRGLSTGLSEERMHVAVSVQQQQ